MILLALIACAVEPPPAGPPPAPPPARSAASSSAAAPPAELPLSLATDIQPIIDLYCIEGCHVAGASYANSLEADVAYQELVDAPSWEIPLLDRVDPGRPELSYLVYKMRGEQGQIGGMGGTMPPEVELPKEDFDMIYRWIEQGAAP